MESENELFRLAGRNKPVSPFPRLLPAASTSFSDSSPADPKGKLKDGPEGIHYHQRCSSESFLIEEQPSWLDDLLNESESLSLHRGHRRSASDTYAYLGGEAAETFAIREKSKFDKFFEEKSGNYEGLGYSTSIETKRNSFDEKNNQESEAVSNLVVEQMREESSLKKLEDSADRTNGSGVKSSASKGDAKRAKQHNAHRSRVRKLQYISQLERTVQILQAEGTQVSAELEFLEQQNIILNMENRTLRQRLETISQEQMIKNWEQEILEREIARLQALYQLQKQQQVQLQNQQQPPQPQHPKQRRNRSRDLDHQVTSYPIKNKEPGSSNGSARI